MCILDGTLHSCSKGLSASYVAQGPVARRLFRISWVLSIANLPFAVALMPMSNIRPTGSRFARKP